METKMFEIRDRGTMIPVVAINMDPARTNDGQEQFLLRHLGFGFNYTLIQLVWPSMGKTHYDAYHWGSDTRTMRVAHEFITDNWFTLDSGQVICVEWILGERKEPKISENLT